MRGQLPRVDPESRVNPSCDPVNVRQFAEQARRHDQPSLTGVVEPLPLAS